ncbi:MAG: AIR synthase-related protein, partial [Allosphingosinicella sp.]
RAAIADGLVAACHDVSDGGLLVALADMAVASGMGLSLDWSPHDVPAHAFWFGEDQGRYLVTTRDPGALADAAEAAGVEATYLGRTGGRAVEDDDKTGAGDRRLRVTLDALRKAHEAFFPGLMGGELTVA